LIAVRSVVGGLTIWVPSLKVTRLTLSAAGSTARKSCIAATAASSRVGTTSVACIESETSTTMMTVAVRFDESS
jgi:hypothetical protein